MRNSNNAIKFLLAQYRAIFKRAYIKGLATAVLLTAGLAAGAAQAAPSYHFLDDTSWTTKTDSEASGGLVAGAIGGNNIGSHPDDETVVSDGNLIIGGSDESALTKVTSGSATAVWGSAESGDITVQDSTITITGSGTVTNTANGFVYGGWVQSLAGQATAHNNQIIIEDKSDNAAAASHGLLGAYVEGHTGAVASNNIISVTGSEDAKQTLSTSGTITAIGANILPIKSGDSASGSGTFQAKENQVDLEYVSVVTDASDDVINIFGSNFSQLSNADATKTKLEAQGNLVALSNSEIETASGSNGNIYGATHEGTFTGTVSFSGNKVSISDTEFTVSGAMTILGANINGSGEIDASDNSVLLNAVSLDSKATQSKGNIAGALIHGTSTDITATGNTATISGSGTTSIDAVAGAYINNTNNTSNAKVNLTVTGNQVTIGSDAKVTAANVAGAIVVVSGSQLNSLNASNNSVTIAGNVTGDVKAVVFTPAGNVADGANLLFENNAVTLTDGAVVQSGSITGGAGKDSKVTIASGSTYTASKDTQDLASDVITIAGKVQVDDGKSLDISGFYQNGNNDAKGYNANLTTVTDTAEVVNSGTINVYGKMVVDADATLTAGTDAAAIIVNGSDDYKSTNELAPSQQVEDAGFGTLVIAKDTLQSYLNVGDNASEDTKSGSLILANATLEFLGEEKVDLASDFTLSGGDTSGAGVITVSGATIKGANLAVSAKLDKVSKDNNLVLDATTLSLGSDSYSGDDSMGFKSATAQNLALAASGAFVLADDIDLKAVTGTEDDYSIASGTLTADDVTISGGKLNVLAGDYSSSTANINVASGSLTIGAEAPAYLDANHEAIAAKLSLTDLEIGESGAVSVFSNGTLNVTTLTTATPTAGNGLTIDGTMNVAGSADTNDNYGVNLAAGSITVNQGGTLSFGEAATAAITLDSTKADQITVAAGTFASGAIVLSGGEVQFAFNSGDVFDADAISELRKEVFNKDAALDGFINLGAGQLKFADNISGGTVAWDDLESYSDIIADTTNFDLQHATVTGITGSDEVQGNVGALQASGAATTINIKGNTVLNDADGENNAFASNESGAVIGVNVKNGADLTLKNGGNIGAVTFANGGDFLVESVASTSGEDADGNPTITYGTTIDSISGASTVTFSMGSSLVEGTTEADQLITQAGTETVFSGAATIGDGNNDATSVLNGTTTFKAAATFKQNAELVGDTTFEQGVTFSGDTYITGDTDVTSGATFYAGAEISNGAILTADTVTVSGQGLIFNVGSDSAEEGTTGTGYLEADLFDLKGNDLFIDPSYDEPTSVAAIKDFGASGSDTDAGTVNGRIFVGKNAALMVGDSASVAAMKEFIAQYQQNGSLVQDQVGAVMYLTDKLTVDDGSRIILDAQNTKDEILWNANNDVYGASGTDADLYLGQNTVLAISDAILDDNAAIHFNKSGASIMAQDDSAKIVLDGSRFLNSRNITLFTDNDSADKNGVLILGDNDIRVETLNGVMYFTLKAGDETTGGTLTLDTSKINTAFSAATDESRDLLLAYASRTANWSEYYTQEAGANIKQEWLVAGVASADEAILDNGAITVKDQNLSQEDFVAIDGVVYRLAHNDFLEAVARNTDGKALDSAALQGVFAGSAQAVMLAAQTSQDAIAGRTGVGASTSALTFADNGQGAGLWINPIYVSQDADGFAVQNKDYGVDIDLYGVALGGDYTLANGVRLGAFFNVGTGEADGSGQADQVSNDFDYWGFGIYAGYSTGAFSVVGDFSYSLVDSDVETNTSVGKLTSSYDTDNISLGITGQYKFEVAGTVITPHLGLRYSSINIDDFDIQAEGYSDGGSFDSDRLNVFSIPVGVTIAKEFAVDSWMVKPSFDLTLTGNFGDDEIESRNSWEGVANWQSNYTAEFLDNFTYGATLGVAAKTGNFSLGVGIGYTGSENTDAFNATANARLTF